MSNYILVCHGAEHEFATFSLAKDQVVQYCGNVGAPLNYGTALAIFKAIYSDPTTSIKKLGIKNFDPPEPLVGPNTFGPDLDLGGDDDLPLFLMNLQTRAYLLLKSHWECRLSQLVNILGEGLKKADFLLYLVCCTEQESANVPMPEGSHLVSLYEEIIK